MTRRSRGIVLVVLASVLLAGEAYLVFAREAGVPSVSWGLERFVAGGAGGGDLHVEQTMLVKAAGLHRIVLWPERTGPDGRGYVVFVLRDMTHEHGSVVVRQRVPLGSVLRSQAYSLEFTSIVESMGLRYRLEISAPWVTAKGLGFRAVRGRHYRDGTLSIGERALWANLMFRASATRATVFARFAGSFENRERFPGSAFLLVMWVVAHAALGFLLVQFARGDRSCLPGSRQGLV